MSSALASLASTAAPAAFNGRRGAMARYVTLAHPILGKGAANARRKSKLLVSLLLLLKSFAPSLWGEIATSKRGKRTEHFDVPRFLVLASFRLASHELVETLVSSVSWSTGRGESLAIEKRTRSEKGIAARWRCGGGGSGRRRLAVHLLLSHLYFLLSL